MVKGCTMTEEPVWIEGGKRGKGWGGGVGFMKATAYVSVLLSRNK